MNLGLVQPVRGHGVAGEGDAVTCSGGKRRAAAMFTFDTVLVTLVLTAPFWWGMGLMLLALLAEPTPETRAGVSRLFDRLERKDTES